MSSTKTGKLRSFKDFLSSTRSLNQTGQSQRCYKSHHQLHGDSGSSITVDNKKNSVSLFDLVDPPLSSSRPSSTCMSNNGPHNGFGYQSVSTYGLSHRVEETTIVQCSGSTSRNPAVRFYHTIRAKLRKRRRDRGNKIVDSKSSSGFGPYIPSNRNSDNSTITLTGNDTLFSPSNWYDSENTINSTSIHPRSMRNIDQVGLLQDSFLKPLGYRENVDQSNDETRATPMNSSSMNNNSIATYPSNTTTRASTSSDSSPKKQQKQVVKVSSPPRSKALTTELCDLLHYGWYWGGLSKDEAEEKLKVEPDGAFVVRDSSSNHYLLSLSFNSNGKTLHSRIEYRNGLFCFYSSETECFPSVAELIDYWIANSQQGAFCYIKSRRTDLPFYPVRLTQPVSRFTEVKSLSYLSRFVIRQYVRLDLIPQLPLPQTLINFIGQQRYI